MKYYTVKFIATTKRRPCFIVTAAADSKKAAHAAAAIAGRDLSEIQTITTTGQR